ncbi:hypothetical protein BGZ68_002271, partial [Mortierella alpina]
MVPHRCIVRLAINNGFTTINSSDRVAFVANPAFDVSSYEVWVPLLNGARIVIIARGTLLDPPLFAAALEYHQVTLLYLSTALLHQYARTIGVTLSKLRYLMGAGEQGLVDAYTGVAKHGGQVCVINAYGPTEANVTTAYPITSTTSQLHRLPIGRPISNTPHYVLDKHLTPLPLGVVGELYIGGPGVANGYLNQPELTAERFLPDPFSKVEGARMYKTCDLVRYMADGNLVFVGRNDNQVKIRGYRVELGEIETWLARHSQVRESVVLAVGKSNADKRLVAYIVAEPHERLVRILREYLSISLPEYMIPSAFVRMDAFPLNNNGKIDRRALPKPTSDSHVTCCYVAPQGDLEIALASMWSDLLKIERVGRNDNFFMLGGHSLLAVRLMNRVSNFGVHMSLSTLFSSPTLCGLAEALGNSVNIQVSTPSVIIPIARGSPMELSLAQQRLWFLAQMDGLSEVYHVPFASRLRGSLDYAALEEALNALYYRHESLRSVFVTVDGHPHVQLLPYGNGFPLVFRDLSDEQDKEAITKDLASQECKTPFDLEKGSSIRAQLLRLRADEHMLLITMHHIVTDGWSTSVMIRELSVLYDAFSSGLANPLPPLSIQYPDYAAWQRQSLTQDKLEDQAAYWRETLAGAPVSIELPTDRPRPSQQSFTGSSVAIHFDSQLTSALKSLSQKHGVTMFMTTLAAWSAILSRLSGQDDIVIGTPSANRNHQQLEQLIGFFVSTLALRLDLSEDPSTGQLLERVRKTTIAAQAHQDIPFEQVIEIIQPPRRTDMTPLFQVMFAWQDNDVDTLKFRGIEAVSEDIDYGVSKFDLELFLSEENGEIVGELNYSTALFDYETIDRHVGYLGSMLRWMTNAAEEPVGTAPILGTSERELLLVTWNSTEQPYPDNACLHQLFEDQVEMSPEAIAIVHDERTLSYRELNAQANEIAYQLLEAGVKPGDYVMLLLDRSIALVASQIAVLKIGAATYDVWAALVHGARIVVIDNHRMLDPYRLADELVRRKVTIFNTNNGLLHQYAYLIGVTLSRLKCLIAGSEQGSCKAYHAILKHGGPVRLDNQYGPTETTVSAVSYTAIGAVDQLDRLPIGRPISNFVVYILDKNFTPVPIGVTGELYIGGAGVANGYLNQPELTAERFLPDPFSKVEGARMYRTGDLVRYMADGNLVFVGRSDNQVKIRGYRVELGEIEARLAEHPQVREAVVVALDEDSDDKRLVAYVVAEYHANLVRILREYLSISLPEYMIPSAF